MFKCSRSTTSRTSTISQSTTTPPQSLSPLSSKEPTDNTTYISMLLSPLNTIINGVITRSDAMASSESHQTTKPMNEYNVLCVYDFVKMYRIYSLNLYLNRLYVCTCLM
eukprot:168773_1